MKRILLGIGTILILGGALVGVTTAFFFDTEVSAGNTFTTGAIDLKVDSESHYNGMVCIVDDQSDTGYAWHSDGSIFATDNDVPLDYYPALGGSCSGTWTETDLGPTNTFFDFEDLKPGDYGENTLSLHVYNNDAYACAVIDNMRDNDAGLTEPEAEAGDTTVGIGAGEMAGELRFFAWDDDGDNVWEDGEAPLFSNLNGPASDVLDGVAYPLYTPDTGAMVASTTQYIGVYWCYGAIAVDQVNTSLSCDGSGVSNLSQTDSLVADISFYVEQARNNEDFECPLPSNDIIVEVQNGDLAQSFADVIGDPTMWFMYNDSNDTIDGTLGSFVAGPGVPPNGGSGSIEFTLAANPFDRKNIATYQFSGTTLASVSAMSYGAYSVSGVAGPNESPFFNFNVDFDGSDTWQNRLVYVPSVNGPVPQDSWNEYDMIDGGGALWTWSKFVSNGNMWSDGNVNQYRTWNDIVTSFPGIRVRVTDPWLGIRVGEPGPTNYTANIDYFSITIGGTKSTFDFEN